MFLESTDNYQPDNLALAEVEKPFECPEAPIAFHVKYSNNKKSYPFQDLSNIFVVYWALEPKTKSFVKYRFEYQPKWEWESSDNPCDHVNDQKGTALYCLKPNASFFGSLYPCEKSSITLGAPIIIDNELAGIFVGISKNPNCDIDASNKNVATLPHLGIAVINSYEEVHPQHKISKDFLEKYIKTESSYDSKDVGKLSKDSTNGNESEPEPESLDLDDKTRTHCLLGGSLELSIKNYIVFGRVFICLLVFIHVSYFL